MERKENEGWKDGKKGRVILKRKGKSLKDGK